MDAEEVICIYQTLTTNNVSVWIVGGWGVDALLLEQTRCHKDLDILMLVDDVVRMEQLLHHTGYGLALLWSENRWVTDRHRALVPTAFVLRDAGGREVDAHAMNLDDVGNGFPAWNAGTFVFGHEDLSVEGVIAGCPVRCISADLQMRVHTGYELPEAQLRDLKLLQQLQASPDLYEGR